MCKPQQDSRQNPKQQNLRTNSGEDARNRAFPAGAGRFCLALVVPEFKFSSFQCRKLYCRVCGFRCGVWLLDLFVRLGLYINSMVKDRHVKHSSPERATRYVESKPRVGSALSRETEVHVEFRSVLCGEAYLSRKPARRWASVQPLKGLLTDHSTRTFTGNQRPVVFRTLFN